MSDSHLPEETVVKAAKLIWGMDQDSVKRPFEKLSGEVQNDLLDTAEAVLRLVVDCPEPGHLSLNQKADAVLPYFSPKWELLRDVAERWGCGSASQLASRGRNLAMRGLVMRRWEGSIMKWRTTP